MRLSRVDNFELKLSVGTVFLCLEVNVVCVVSAKWG